MIPFPFVSALTPFGQKGVKSLEKVRSSQVHIQVERNTATQQRLPEGGGGLHTDGAGGGGPTGVTARKLYRTKDPNRSLTASGALSGLTHPTCRPSLPFTLWVDT